MFGRLGAPEIVLLLVVLVLLFGAKRLPDMARSFGQSLRIIKSETRAMRKDEAEVSQGDVQAVAPVLPHTPVDRQASAEATEAETAHRR
ncbi:Sec-independent protein translocase subunit TatA [Streptomyces adustus]|uniref:Sec-independent protein translocase subunit TatA n=1 Tax=Streptomyces adustus TaxID=1609272 RepID=UPI0037180F67